MTLSDWLLKVRLTMLLGFMGGNLKIHLYAIAAMSVFLAAPAEASTVTWTDWTSTGVGTVTGNMGGVTVTYSGPYSFAELGSGINYWTEGSPAPYTGNAVIDNAPTPSEMVALDVAGTHTISFSQAILNPIMAIVSMGQFGLPVSYDFDAPFTVLSSGQGYWSGGNTGTYTLGLGDILTGSELHAAIQFTGLLSSISWISSPNEYWHGITVGAVPLPAGIPLLISAFGLLGLFGYRQRKNNRLAAA